VLFIDLDRFKLINDTLGHHVGDRLIAEVGRRIRRCLRGGDTVGRVSGDEFGVVLTDLAQADDAALVAQKILDGLSQAVRPRRQRGLRHREHRHLGVPGRREPTPRRC
jgi:diguanylate cyclase (GGDEF)-like protein